MRYSDGLGVECEVHVEAGPSRVWGLVTDIELPARLSPELQRVEWLDGATAPAVGARFAGHNHHPQLGDWRTVSQIVELDSERAFGWVVMDADGRFGEPADVPSKSVAAWRFVLTADADGTRLRQSMRIGPGRSGLDLVIDRRPDLAEKLVTDRLNELRANIGATLDGIKTHAEGGH